MEHVTGNDDDDDKFTCVTFSRSKGKTMLLSKMPFSIAIHIRLLNMPRTWVSMRVCVCVCALCCVKFFAIEKWGDKPCVNFLTHDTLPFHVVYMYVL